ncbi:hypothetical protein PPYR_03247 [Photinus pyralis]|uniref:C2H2-type domain-containing protein n=1 Tax=Photinus pyralis TaxID=7054 RepID=A0A5N4A2A6_PHOPY|nr:hypothetical protein PPYR_03247 [Photinus pyralis]
MEEAGKNICRFCLAFIPLNSELHLVKDLEKDLLDCLPELNLHIPLEPISCQRCFDDIQSMYAFKRRFLTTKRLLQELADEHGPITTDNVLEYVKGKSEHLERTEDGDVDLNTGNTTNVKEEAPNRLRRRRIIIKFFRCRDCRRKLFKRNRRGFPVNTLINRKRRVVDRREKYKCEQCEFVTVYKHRHRSHLQAHVQLKPFQCYDCNYCTNRKDNLAQHVKIHADFKPYRCDSCDYKSRRLSNLKSHLNKHRNMRPFLCDQCKATFSRKANVKKHILAVHFRSAKLPTLKIHTDFFHYLSSFEIFVFWKL